MRKLTKVGYVELINWTKLTSAGLRQLVYLNCIVDTHEHLLFRIPSQRLIFFVKHLISQAHDNVPGIQVQTEMMKILKVVVTPIKEIYGVFWEELIDLVQRAWAFLDRIGDDEIPLLHASLRLFQQLKRLKQQESNDDLQDAWSEKQVSLDKGLLNLLIYLQGMALQLGVSYKRGSEISNRHIGRIARSSKDCQCSVGTTIESHNSRFYKPGPRSVSSSGFRVSGLTAVSL